MNRQVACAAGAMLLIGLGGWASPAFSQGAMTPRPPDVRVAPPPAAPPPVVAPPPMAPAMAPTTVPVPVAPTPGARTTTAGPAGGPPPLTGAPTKALPGLGIGVRGPGGTRQATSDANGVVSLGPLGPGRHELTLSVNTPASPSGILISLLIPAVARLGQAPQPTTVEHSFPPSVLAKSRDLRIQIVVPEGGGSPKVDWGDGSPLTDVARDGAATRVRVSADVSTIRVQNY